MNSFSKKEKIIETIKSNGPALPVQISKAIELSPLFASAYLSELYSEKEIKISNMKVGSSPLYYLEGQEEKLENFIQYLNPKEKEAFELLKENKVLRDKNQTPVIRVALRAIKDFAIPVKIKKENESEIYWAYHLLNEQEIRSAIQNPQDPKPIEKLEEESPKEEKEKLEEIKEKPEENNQQKEEEEEEENSNTLKEEPNKQKPEENQKPEEKEESPKEEALAESKTTESEEEEEKNIEKPKTKKPKPKTTDHAFPNNLKEYLQAKDIEILETSTERKKEFTGKIRIDTLFGKQEFYLIAKDKKTVNENDLALALQKARDDRMIAIYMCSGKLNKKAESYLKEWRSYIKFEKLNF